LILRYGGNITAPEDRAMMNSKDNMIMEKNSSMWLAIDIFDLGARLLLF